ncbi:hypothetical protein E5S67_04677 [Microcoleus sp. IPMA8]|uniref:Secreted protein n=1 Tax=Microcoleus asticus IPMA8 TaxID=2563858 RepID=A0ABX2D2Q0_9CYAN|nr:hypothetical protein [Microcoleus asticus IPMA8]
MFTVPLSIRMAPPPWLAAVAVFSVKMLLRMFKIPPPCLIAPPPKPLTVLAVKVELVIVTVPPLLNRAPPPPAVLPEKVTLVRFRVTPKPLRMPPVPLAKVRLEMLTGPVVVLSICTALLPLTVKLAAPGPFRVTLSLIVGSVVARVIVPVMAVRSIVSAPALALARVMASRSEFAPESLVLVTEKVTKTWL